MADNHDGQYQYPLDTTGRAATNLVQGERQVINPGGFMDYYVLVPKAAPFFRDGFKIRLYPGGEELQPGVHYGFSHLFMSAQESIGVGTYGSITFYDHTLQGTVELDYQTLGGSWTLSEEEIANVLANILTDPRITSWEQVTGMPTVFPPIDHEHNIDDFFGADDIVEVLERIRLILENSGDSALQIHIADKENPHQTNKGQIGLGLVENYPIALSTEANSTRNDRYMTPQRTREAMQLFVVPLLNAHISNVNNPHGTTKGQVGLGSVENFPIAIRQEAEAGLRNDRYMTPLTTAFLIDARVTGSIGDHVDDLNNPHQTNKGQVGLGSVENFPIATLDEAREASRNDRYMTPARTGQAIEAQAIAPLNLHIANTANPHGTTKAHVGLNLVENYGIADELAAKQGTRNDLYMTPARTFDAIVEQALFPLASHMNDTNNPHQTDKNDVGLGAVANYPIASDTQAREGTSDQAYMTPARTRDAILNIQAGDASKVFGRDEAQTIAWIGTLTAGNATRVYGLNVEQLRSDILSGTAANSTLFAGRTWSDVEALAGGGNGGVVGPTDRHYIQQVLPDEVTGIPAAVSWTRFARLPAVLPVQFSIVEDMVILLSGGAPLGGDAVPVQRLTIAFDLLTQPDDSQTISVTGSTITSLDGFVGPDVCWRVAPDAESSDPFIEFWLRDGQTRTGVSFLLESSTEILQFVDVLPQDPLIVNEPVGMTYTTRVDIGPSNVDLYETLNAGFDDLNAKLQAI